MTLGFDPFAPFWALAAVAIVAALFSALGVWRNWRSGLLRALAMLFLIGLLANPQLREAEKTPLDDIALVLVDESLSQTLDSRDEVTAAAAEN